MSLVPQVGMAELFMLGILALIIVGPKDLPRLFNRAGKAMAHVRRMADEFRSSFDQMAREAEIEDMRKEIEALKASNPVNEVNQAMKEAESEAMRPLSAAENTPEKNS